MAMYPENILESYRKVPRRPENAIVKSERVRTQTKISGPKAAMGGPREIFMSFQRPRSRKLVRESPKGPSVSVTDSQVV